MNGVEIQGYSIGSVEAAKLESVSSFVYCEYTFMFYATTQLTYQGVTSLVATGATDGTVSLIWKRVVDNWAMISGADGQIIKYATGSAPPPDVDSGLDGPPISGTDESAVISGLSSGQYAISVFTAYKESGAATEADRYSPPTTYVVNVP
jgi:hypothetical protein